MRLVIPELNGELYVKSKFSEEESGWMNSNSIGIKIKASL